MPTTLPPRPTLWRTCRVLANSTRLVILRRLFQRPNQPVSAIAEYLKLPLPVASQCLRALEARGLLTVRRTGRRVAYRPAPEDTGGLVEALKAVLLKDPRAIGAAFKLATAFTHPRRIATYRALQREPQTLTQLSSTTGFSARALLRHVGKLEARGFATHWRRTYCAATPPDPFGRVLSHLASTAQ